MKKIYFLIAAIGFSTYTVSAQKINVVQPKIAVGAKSKTLVTAGAAQTANSMHQPNLGGAAVGQPCATDYLMDAYLDEKGIRQQFEAEVASMNLSAIQALPGERVTYTLPVIFHVVYNPNNAAENVSHTALVNLLNQMNLDYTLSNTDASNARSPFVPANVDINFCLAMRDPLNQPLSEPGVHRVSTTEDYYDPDTESNKMKYDASGGGTGTPAWDRTRFINVWVCDITNGASSGTAGYAYRPTTSSLPPSDIDGIVIDYNLGVNPANRVLTHEMGHFLGLSHTWGNSNTASGCSVDDGLTDTPNTAGPSFNYPGSCSGSQQTCSGTETQYENFMDYSNCQVMFTAQQAALMNSVIGSSRISLTTSNACTPVNPAPPVADFSATPTTIVAGGSINFTDLSTNYPNAWSWSVTPSTGVTFIGGTTNTSQNPVIQFANVGTYTVQLTASNSMGSDVEIKTNYITVVASGGGSTACDTLRNYTTAEAANMTAYGITGESGYYPGTATLNSGALQVLEVAEKYTAAAPTQVRGVYLPIYQADDMGAATNVSFKVYSHDATNNVPLALIGTAHTMPISGLNAGYWNEIQFNTPVSVSGTFWISMSYTYSGAFDTIVLATTDFSDRPAAAGTGTAAMNISGGVGWRLTSNVFGSTPNSSIIMDALTSNGPSPVAAMSINPTVACATTQINMNGYGSTNTSSYVWYFDDGTNLYYYDQGNLSTTFTQGSWTVELDAQGSCQTDIATQSLTINPALTATYTTNPENCTAEDGTLAFTVSGGDGSGYNYSINGGATYQTSNSFNGLSAGTYSVEINDGSNCALESTAVVNNQNTFNPSVSPNITINLGDTTNLAVTGGTSWSWFEGNINIGTTQNVDVSPTQTTTYYVYVEDANGCGANLTVTVTVNTASGIASYDWTNALTVYPNPSTGLFNVRGSYPGSAQMSVEVVDLIGKVVNTRTWNIGGDYNQVIDLSALSEGMYLVKFTTSEKTHTIRVNVVR